MQRSGHWPATFPRRFLKCERVARVSENSCARLAMRRILGRTGTSNEAVEGPFRIEPEGRARPWLLILDRRYLFGVAAAASAMAG